MKKTFCCLLIFFTYCAIAQNVSPNFGWPVNTVNESNNRGKITGTPSEYRSPYTGGSAVIFGVTISGHRYHQGIDIANSHGQNVYSIEDNNSIVEIEGSSSSGNRRIRIGNTVYWHVDENPILFDGATVDKNDIIGTTNAGNLAPHLHIQPSPSTIFDSANFLTYKFNNYQDCSIPNFDSNSSGELIIEFYENGHSKIEGLSSEMNQDINGSNLIFGNIDLVVGVNDERTLPDCNGANDGGNLGINKIQFKIKNENEIFHENNQIDFSNLPDHESAGHINGHYSSSSNHRYVVTNDPFNIPYDKYLNTKKKNNSADIFNPDDLSQYALFNLESIIPDNIYNLEITVSDIDSDSENENFNSSSILIDNFLPYIKKVTLSDSGGIFYEGEWTLNNSETALEFDQCTLRNGISTGFNIQIETSETMNNLSMNLAGVTNNLISTNNEKTVWELQNPFTGNASSNQTITFTGSDTAGNPLLIDPSNLYWRTGDDTWQNGTTNQPITGNGSITGADTIHKINMSVNCSDSCTDNYEPNDTQSQATPLYVFGHDFSWSDSLVDECLNQATADIDWYRMNLTHQGELTITLSSQQISSLFMDWLDNGNVTSSTTVNGEKQIVICSNNGPACYDTALRIYTVTQNGNDPIPYTLDIQWLAGQSCASGRQSNTNSTSQNNLTITINGNTSVCEGLSNTLSASGASGPFDWFVNGQSVHIGNTFNTQSLNTGQYDLFVIATDDVCSFAEVQLNITSGVTANAGSDITIQANGSTTLQGSGGSSCSWSPTTGLSNPNSCTTAASPSQTTTYTLTVTENGCTDTDTVIVTVDGSSGGNPPVNDDCSNATTLTSNTSCSYVGGTVEDATPSFGANNCLGCSCTSPDDYDVYYKFIAVETSHTVTVSNYASNFDAVIELRTDCASGTTNYISCYDPSGAPTSVSETWNGLTKGQTYYIRVFEWNYQGTPPNADTFDICVTHQNTNTDGIDLISDITSVSNDSPDAGDSITVNYTITNNGDVTMTSNTTSALYLSSNQTYGSSDILITGSIYGLTTNLSPNQSINLSPTVTLPNVSDGQYYIISYPDLPNLITESNNDNNTDAYAIQIGDVVTNGPNLDVRRARAVPDNGLVPGQEVEMEIRIENDGNEDSNGFDVLVYLDIDDDGNPDSNEVMGEFAFSALDADEDETVFKDFNLPANIPSEDSYDLYVLADSNNDINETDENDNDKRDSVTIVLVNNDAENDLVVLNQTVSNTNVNVGENVDVTVDHVYLGNNTTDDLPSISLGYYLSTDCNLSIDDILLDDETSNIGINNPVQDEDDTLTIPIGTQTGTYYILFVADNEYDIDEGNFEDNNVECVEITVNNSNTPEGDIFITDETCNPSNVLVGNHVGSFINVNYSGNVLDANIPSLTINYYLSNDCTLSDDDIFLEDSNTSVGSDNPINGEVYNLELPNNLTPGTYFIISLVDAENELYEIDENNNVGCSEFQVFSSSSTYQDVTLSNPYVAVTEANAGDLIYISVFQNYTGYQTQSEIGGSVRVQYYLSTDCLLSLDDVYLEDDPSTIGSTDSSDFEFKEVTIPSGTSAGMYYILFFADGENIVAETDEDNNVECVPITINDGALSVDDSELNSKIKVYPNPVSNILTINLGEIHSKINLEIFNAIGQRVNLLKFDNKQTLSVNTSSLSSGIYFFKIKTDSINSVEFKIIKE